MTKGLAIFYLVRELVSDFFCTILNQNMIKLIEVELRWRIMMKQKSQKTTSTQMDLRDIFLGLQDQMICRLNLNRRTHEHPVAKGDASEDEWIDLLSSYLPTRYQVERAFIIDHKGRRSEQIDIVIFDRHYSPFLFKQNGQKYIPAESVYAVFEVKQELNNSLLAYASSKIRSVRQLERTSASIVNCGIPQPPREVPRIIAGFLCLTGSINRAQEKKLLAIAEEGRINIGCSLDSHSFLLNECDGTLKLSKKDDALIFFFLHLLELLQAMGTVPPMEISKYAKVL